LGVVILGRNPKFAGAAAALHVAAVAFTQWYTLACASSGDGQCGMVWALWAFIDLPFSLPLWELWGNLPVIHGLVGTAWWFILVLFLTPRSKSSALAVQ